MITKKDLRDIFNEFDNGYYNIKNYNYIVVYKPTKTLCENSDSIDSAKQYLDLEIENRVCFGTSLKQAKKEIKKEYQIINLNDYKENDTLPIMNWV